MVDLLSDYILNKALGNHTLTLSKAIPTTGSEYADRLPGLIADLRRAVVNEFGWRLPFDAYNLLPGERQGQFLIESFDADGDRPDLEEVRAGRMAKVISFTLWHQTAFDAQGMSGDEAATHAEATFISEAVAIEHRLGRISSYLDAPDWIEKLVVSGAVDPRRSTPLKDGGRTWVIDVTTDVALTFFVNSDLYGQHLSIGAIVQPTYH